MIKGLLVIILGLLGLPALLALAQPGSEHSIVTTVPDRPTVADQFDSPYGPVSTTTDYDLQWNIIISDTRYGVRNLSLPNDGRRCWGVTWNRTLHAGIDLYRLDGQDAAGTMVYAIADGQVAYYNPGYASYPGRVVILSHLLDDERTLYSMYAHLGSVSVSQGQSIARGQPIGTILYQPDDSHLHFELRWFFNGASIYPTYTTCNGLVYGRGYTYLIHPDDFPRAGQGYVDPDAFIQAHGGPALTPIGLPDPRQPITQTLVASADLQLTTGASALSAGRSLPGVSSDSGVGGPGVVVTPTQKIAPTGVYTSLVIPPLEVTNSIAPPLLPAAVQTETLTNTAYLPLIMNGIPRLEPACVEGQDLLSNAGFESGLGSEPWVQVRNGPSDLISNTQAFSGTYSLWLGGRNLADEEALQSVLIPYDTDALTLTFKRLLTTQEYEPLVYDHFELVLENQVGNEVTPQVSFSNLSANRNVWVAETVVFSGFEAWGNRRLRLSLKGMTDITLPTSFFVDDVALQTRCVP